MEISEPLETGHTETNFKLTQEWFTVRAVQYKIAIHLSALPGKNNEEKKGYAYRMVQDIASPLSTGITTLNGNKAVVISFENEADATAACKIPVSDKDFTTFVGIKQFGVYPSQDGHTYVVKLFNVPLDVEKNLFETALNKHGKTKSIKYVHKKLYFHVIIEYASNTVASFWNNKWCYNFGKLSFQCEQPGLSGAEKQLRRKFTIKLANLPKGCSIFELSDVLKQVNAMTCFIPKKNDQSYSRERVAYITFKSQEDLEKAKATNFIINNRAL